MVAFASSHRRTSKPKQCVRRKDTCTYNKAPAQLAAFRYYHRSQQYSVIALTDGGGTVKERYAYDAYGIPTILDAAGTTRTTSAENNRYLYTGREWDETLGLYHYRARMYDSVAGRFCSRDPIGFIGSQWSLYEFLLSSPLTGQDAFGLKRHTVSAKDLKRINACIRNNIKSNLAASTPAGAAEATDDACARKALQLVSVRPEIARVADFSGFHVR
ncbi:tRNA3(Ser)-specific nuclease WapA precursor [Planctomycetes bacterium CA13]|uniref:tRNA3(Ser)-specific nuclease WapA n=1 Tax=Novipirellula herctigrandis TaxID=2527986 RepID=A0A5C5Z9X5_9BACT|nr:tRNA3(Ser)-specific nuclease WapA precursor [Planctomycetes bacterium CA13]